MSPRLLTGPAVVAVLAGGFYVISRNVPTGGLAAIAAGAAWVAAATAIFAWLARRDRGALGMVIGAAVITVLVGGFLIRPQGNVVDEVIVNGEPAAVVESAVAAEPETPAKPAPAAKRATPRKSAAAKRATTRKPAAAAKPATQASPAPAAKGATPAKRAAAAKLTKPAAAAKPAATSTPDEESQRPRNVQVLSGTFSGESGHRGRGKAAVVELAGGGRKLTFSEFDVDPGAGGLRVYLAAGRPTSDGEVKDFIDLAALKGTTGDQQYDVPDDVDLGRYSTVIVWCVPFTTRIAQATLG